MPHIHDKIDFTVDVYIVYKNRVLLRKHDKYKVWLVPGGHIELDEDPNQAAIREVKEEVGLDIVLIGNNKIKSIIETKDYKELIPPKFLNIHRINDTHHHISFVYFAIAKDENLKLSAVELSEECRWFAYEEITNSSLDLKESVREYAKAALHEISNLENQ